MVKYTQTRPEQLRIAKSYHIDPTSGHMGVKKIVMRIKERFMWKGVWNDAREIVSQINLRVDSYFWHY